MLIVTATRPGGQTITFKDEGKNFTLGLAAQLFQCTCGESRFVEGGDEFDCQCGTHFRFEEDPDQVGYLHADEDPTP
jgi:hypothetical protein